MTAEQPSARTARVRADQLFQRGFEFHGRGSLDEAAGLYEAALAARPDHAHALHMLGILRFQQGRAADAARHLRAASRLTPTDPMVWLNLGTALERLGQLQEALAALDKAIGLKPDHVDAFNNRGNVLVALGRPRDAVASYEEALALNPGMAQLHFNRANAQQALGRPLLALEGFGKALALKADYVEAWCNKGALELGLGRLEDALASYDRAIAVAPGFADAHNNRGSVLRKLERLDEALVSFAKALSLRPEFVEAMNNQGNALLALERAGDALVSYDRAIALRPDHVEVWNNRGNALIDLERYADALASFDRALVLRPDYPEATSNRGNALMAQRRFAEALTAYERALSLRQAYPEAWLNRGNALQCLERPAEALACYERALALTPDYADAHSNKAGAFIALKRPADALTSSEHALSLQADHVQALIHRADALRELKRLDEALACYRRAAELDSDSVPAIVGSMYLAAQVCDWQSARARHDAMIAKCAKPDFDIACFPFLALCDDPAIHRTMAETCVRNRIPLDAVPRWRARGQRDRIRVGYLSADFKEHPVGTLIVELIERHDRKAFEVYGVDAGTDDGSSQRRRLFAAFDHVIDVGTLTDKAAAELIANADIDILVDLGGHTKDTRLFALSHRPAPVQVSYLGYAATTGAPHIDYLIADGKVVPPAERVHYSEKLVMMPDSFLCNDGSRAIGARMPSRDEQGLPSDGFVFCCFNNSYKLNPEVFDVWMRVLRSLPNSVLWLSTDNRWAQDNLRREAAARDVDPSRLVFARREPDNADHLARMRLADLFLDTRPYNAHTTASDALWVGLPVLTCPGRSFASRVAASLLEAIGLPELVVSSLGQYETTALRLATSPAELDALRARLAGNRSTHALFDTDRFARDLERAFEEMWRLHTAGEAPRDIDVGRLTPR